MSAELVVLVPTLGRPHRIDPLLAAIEETAPGAAVLFLADPCDTEALAQIGCQKRDLTITTDVTGGSYAEKINRGVELSTEPLIFAAANDLEPQPGWIEAAEAKLTDGTEVVGVNDMLERTRDHATHFLFTRTYAEQPTIDGQVGPMCTEYVHEFVDDEFIATARKRCVYAYAPEAKVQHLHPVGGLAPDDEVYQRGREHRRADRRRFRRRLALWA